MIQDEKLSRKEVILIAVFCIIVSISVLLGFLQAEEWKVHTSPFLPVSQVGLLPQYIVIVVTTSLFYGFTFICLAVILTPMEWLAEGCPKRNEAKGNEAKGNENIY